MGKAKDKLHVLGFCLRRGDSKYDILIYITKSYKQHL
uniref:Uncharacterized protein n=1 Tax=Rhizophora mucronata TaxID=61149 RepID=A0A2P2NLQ7_RHIMU